MKLEGNSEINDSEIIKLNYNQIKYKCILTLFSIEVYLITCNRNLCRFLNPPVVAIPAIYNGVELNGIMLCIFNIMSPSNWH